MFGSVAGVAKPDATSPDEDALATIGADNNDEVAAPERVAANVVAVIAAANDVVDAVTEGADSAATVKGWRRFFTRFGFFCR